MNILDAAVIQEYIRMCDDVWLLGWHERNAGNLTYRMDKDEVMECEAHFENHGEWVDMGVTAKNLSGEFFITTGAGKFFRNVSLDAKSNIGIVEIDETGKRYRVVWGLSDCRPTSEFPSHILNHSVKKDVTKGKNRIIYHAHPPAVISLTSILPLTAKDFSNALWRTITECPIVFPAGVGVVDWMMPGGTEVAELTGRLMNTFDAVVWAHHGMFVSGSSFDEAFGLMHTIEKSADIYIRTVSTGKDVLGSISDEQLCAVAKEFNLENFNYSLLESINRPPAP